MFFSKQSFEYKILIMVVKGNELGGSCLQNFCFFSFSFVINILQELRKELDKLRFYVFLDYCDYNSYCYFCSNFFLVFSYVIKLV